MSEIEIITDGGRRRRWSSADKLRIVDAYRPVEHARYLLARFAGAVTRDALHVGDQFMVVDAKMAAG